jgi:hypothetical protein
VTEFKSLDISTLTVRFTSILSTLLVNLLGLHLCGTRFRFVHALNTSSQGTLNMCVMEVSCFPGSAIKVVLDRIFFSDTTNSYRSCGIIYLKFLSQCISQHIEGLVPAHLRHLAVFAFRHSGMPQGEPGLAITGVFKSQRHRSSNPDHLGSASGRDRCRLRGNRFLITGAVKSFGPHQRLMCSGSVQASHTRSTGGSKIRSITNSRPATCSVGLFILVIFFILCLQ